MNINAFVGFSVKKITRNKDGKELYAICITIEKLDIERVIAWITEEQYKQLSSLK